MLTWASQKSAGAVLNLLECLVTYFYWVIKAIPSENYQMANDQLAKQLSQPVAISDLPAVLGRLFGQGQHYGTVGWI